MNDKLEINKNGIPVQVAASERIGDMETLVIGDYQRNMILRTKGSVRIQINNKFYDITSDEINAAIENNGIIVIDDEIGTLTPIPANGTFIYSKKNGSLYLIIDGSPVPIVDKDGENAFPFLSYETVQFLNQQQVELMLRNGKFKSNDEQEFLTDAWENKMGYVSSTNQHYVFINGSIKPLYISTINGGVVNNGITITTNPTAFKTALLNIDGVWDQKTISERYNGLFIGRNDLSNGLGLHNDGSNQYIQYGNNLTFRTLDGLNDIVIINNEGVGINQYPISGYSLSVKDSTYSDDFKFGNDVSSVDFTSVGESDYWDSDYAVGASIHKPETDWILEVDDVILRNPKPNIQMSGLKGQKILSNTFRILTYVQTGNANQIEIDTDLIDVAINDLLIGIDYDYAMGVENYLFLKVLSIESTNVSEGTVSLLVESYGLDNGKQYQNLIKINKPNVLLDTFSQSVIGYKSLTDILSNLNITDWDDIIDLQDNNEAVHLKISSANIHSVLGNLTNVTDADFTFSSNDGFYSNNAYIKGDAILRSLTLGTELIYDSTGLVIQDLEVVKNRTISGTDGLNGGGTLFTNDIVIKHNTALWSTKADLVGGLVISNLTLDAYGHLTDWKTRTLTTSDIVEGTNLYAPLLTNGNFFVGGTTGNTQRKILPSDLGLTNEGDLLSKGSSDVFTQLSVSDTSTNSTIVKRTSTGTIVASDAVSNNELVTLTQLNSYLPNKAIIEAITQTDIDNWNAGTSDALLKKDISVLENSLSKIQNISGYSFKWLNDNSNDYGVIAQEVEKILPDAVIKRSSGFKAVKYDRLIPLLIESVKELNKEIEELKRKIK